MTALAESAAPSLNTSWPTELRSGRMVEVDYAQEVLDEECKALVNRANRLWRTTSPGSLERFALAAEACGVNPLTQQPYYTAEDFASWWQAAEEKNCREPTLGSGTLARLYRFEIVPNALLRKAVERLCEDGELSLALLAKFIPSDLVRDDVYLGRLLGFSATSEKNGRALRWYMQYEQAVAIARAIGIRPQEVGI